MQKSKKAEFALSEELKTDEEWDDAMQKQVCCLVVQLVSWLVGQLVSWLVGQLVGQLIGWFAGWLVSQ